MAYTVGSLGDFISGTQDAAESKANVIFVPKEYNYTIKTNEETGTSDWPSDANRVPYESQVADEKLTSLRYENLLVREKKLHREKKVIEKWNSEEQELRTVIVKNLPNSVNVRKIKYKFEKFGEIDAVRLRCAAREDLRDRKKVAVIKKKFHSQRTNICAFIRYKDPSSADAALNANCNLFQGYRIFVHRAVETKPHEQKKAIFVGNLPFDTEENELYAVFEDCGEIYDIRIVRDKETGIGKGFGYVNFKNRDAVELALKMSGVSVKGREVRIMRSKNITQSEKLNSNVNKNKKNHDTKKEYNKEKKQKVRKVTKQNLEEKADDELSFPRGGNVHANENKSSSHPKKSDLSGERRKDDGMNIDFYNDYKKIFKTHPNTDTKQKPETKLPFQGRVMTDKKKKKKKMSREVSRKKKIAAILTNKKKIKS